MSRFTRSITKGLATLAVAAVLLGLGLLVAVPRVTGAKWLTVLTGSMSPTIPAGSLVLVKPVDPTTIQAGDVITWQARPGVATFVTHRVARVEERAGSLQFVTKGDANEGEDTQPVVAGSVRGRVEFHVPHLGTLRRRLLSPFGLGLAVAGFGAAAFVTQAARLLRARRQPGDADSGATPGASPPPMTVVETSEAVDVADEPEAELSGNAWRPMAGHLVALVALVCVAAAGGLVATFASHSDFVTLSAEAGAANWALAEAPPECAGMTFDNVIEGSYGDNELHGTSGSDLILGFYGNDKLYGENGKDCLVGGPGDDLLDGGNGKDVLVGGAGKDSFGSGNGKDTLYGGPDDDTLLGQNAPDVLDGGDGTDTCNGGHAPDVVNCEDSDETP